MTGDTWKSAFLGLCGVLSALVAILLWVFIVPVDPGFIVLVGVAAVVTFILIFQAGVASAEGRQP
ncbi:hypothetical protein [Bauldia litoralis]|uniref:hypothetical protein n=1 Tax=Bauldia litoralis TaxID=665467 RepID=UPI003265FE98